MKKLFLLAAMCCLVMNLNAAHFVVIELGDRSLVDDIDSNPYEGVSWKASTRTITLNNANLNFISSKYGLFVYSKDVVTIVVQGKNTLNVSQFTAIYHTDGALSIVGASNDAELTVISGTKTAIQAFQGCSLGGGMYPLKLNLQGATYGISHGDGSLSIANNVTLNIAATTNAAIYGSGSVTLAPGLYVTKPLGAEFDGGTLELDGKYVKSAVTIEPHNLTEYNLWVKGKRVNDLNQSDIFRDKKVSYNPTTKTLTLDNTDIAGGTKNSAIKTSISGLKIDVQGTCYLTSSSSTLPAVQCSATTTLTSSGANAKVTIQNPNNAAIINDGCALNIDGGSYGMTVNIDGKSGIQGKNSGTLSIKNTTLNISATTSGAIYGQNSINLNDCAITQPTVAQIYNGAIVDKNNKVVCEEVTIRKVEKYPLYVAGIQVNEVNYKNITGDGKVIYNPSSKTLTLRDGANISCSTKSPIFSGVDGLTLLCEGKATLSYTGSSASEHGLYVTGSTTILSNLGSLTINSPNAAIYSTECTTTIRAITLTLNGKKYGFRGMPSDEFSSNLEIVRADVNIAATTNGAISNISSLTLTDIEIMEPAKCSFSASKMGLVDASNTIVTSAVMMETVVKYGVYVKGVQVTSKNCSDILGDGKVTYVEYDNTLTLNNANIVYDGTEVIGIYQDLTINCIGENTVYCTNTTNGSAIGNGVGKTTITGSGTLLAKSDAMSAIYGEYDLTISDGCKVTAQSAKGFAVSIASEPLTIDNATLIAKGNGKDATINGCANLVLNNAEITSGHTYDATTHKFLDAEGNEAKDDIIIGVEGTGLEELTVDNAQGTVKKMIIDNHLYIRRDNNLYNATGVRVK